MIEEVVTCQHSLQITRTSDLL